MLSYFTRLYCGFEDAIEIFDVQRPGQGERLPTTPSKKSKDGLKGEQSVVDHGSCLTQIPVAFADTSSPRLSNSCVLCKGIISTLAFSYSPEYYAAGSLTPASRVSDNIALFNESALEPVLSIGGVARWEKGGVTQVGGISNSCFVRLGLKSKPPHHSLRPYIHIRSNTWSLVHRSLPVDVQSHTTSYFVRCFQTE